MEHRRESGTPVNLNALQIGEKTVPKGCRVIHVSSHGMLLHCEADTRSHTFSDGDSLDIHLTVQHNDEQKKLTIPSYVRHATDNSLDVEFHHPDPVLLDLIESYRTSSTHKLEASIGEVHTGDAGPDVIPLPGSHTPAADSAATEEPAEQPQGRRPWYIFGSILLIGLIIMLAGNYLYTSSLHTRVSALAELVDDRGDTLAEMQNRVFSASLLEGKYASLDARMSALSSAMSTLNDRVYALSGSASGEIMRSDRKEPQPAAGVVADDVESPPTTTGKAADTAQIPAPTSEPVTGPVGRVNRMAEKPSASIAGGVDEKKPVVDPDAPQQITTAPDSKQTIQTPASSEPMTKIPTAPSAARPATGPWAINLMSSVDRQYVASVADKAQARGIATELNSANVKGRQYWRLQVTGFKSLAAARSRATEIQQILGIDEVWYHKRKTN